MDSHALFLTANTSTLYIFPYINTKEADGALVVEVPPGMLGAFNDAWLSCAGVIDGAFFPNLILRCQRK